MLTVAALRAVIGHSEPEELAACRLALERARMEREDFRQGGGPSDIWASPGTVAPLSLRRYVENLQEAAEDLIDDQNEEESEEEER
jgi:hypothetical protein